MRSTIEAEKGIKLLSQAKGIDNKLHSDLCFKIANNHFCLNQYENSIKFYFEAYNLILEEPDSENKGHIFHNVGACHMKMNEYILALPLLSEAARCYKAASNDRLVSGCYFLLGKIYAAMNEHNTARIFLTECLSIKRKLDLSSDTNLHSTIELLNSISRI